MSRIGVSLTGLMYTSCEFSRPRSFIGVGGSFTGFDPGYETFSPFGAHALGRCCSSLVEALSTRIAAGAGRFFENDDVEARWTIFATAGISFRNDGPAGVALR